MNEYIVRAGTNMTRVFADSPTQACKKVLDRLGGVYGRTFKEYMDRGYLSARLASNEDQIAFRICVRESSPAYRKEAKALLRQMRTRAAA